MSHIALVVTMHYVARLNRFLILCASFLVIAPSAHAGVFAYATNHLQELWKVDLTTPTSVMISNIGFVAQGLAETSNGKLYATDGNKLYNVTGGVPVPLANLGALSVGALDSAGTTLWGYDNASNRMFEYDAVGNTFLNWSPTLAFPSRIDAMAIDSAGDFLVVDNIGHFAKITKATWTTSLIKTNLGLADTCTGLDFLSDGNLYALVYGDTRYRLDPTNGNVLNGFFSGVHRDWADMTTLPAPEPASLVIMGGGVLAFLRRRIRR